MWENEKVIKAGMRYGQTAMSAHDHLTKRERLILITDPKSAPTF